MTTNLEMSSYRPQQEQSNLLAYGTDPQGRQYQQYTPSGMPNPMPGPQHQAVYVGQPQQNFKWKCKKFDIFDKVLIVGAISTSGMAPYEQSTGSPVLPFLFWALLAFRKCVGYCSPLTTPEEV